MKISPAFETPLGPERPAAVAASEVVTLTRPANALLSAQCSRRILRFGGLTMDAVIGATSWRGKTVEHLTVADRELLRVFLSHGGQIIRCQRLAATLGISVEALDRHVKAVRETLKGAGSTCLPHTVAGLGYILWWG